MDYCVVLYYMRLYTQDYFIFSTKVKFMHSDNEENKKISTIFSDERILNYDWESFLLSLTMKIDIVIFHKIYKIIMKENWCILMLENSLWNIFKKIQLYKFVWKKRFKKYIL